MQLTESPPVTPSYALDEVRWISVGGMPQAFHLLAANPAAPVMLFLHGGPGVPHMPFAYVNAALASSYVLVNWDQRGAGKSYKHTDTSLRVTIDQLVSDGCEVVDYLCHEFRTDAIFVVGHSCGSAIGMHILTKIPGRIRGFVGLGQVSNLRDAQDERFYAARHLARMRRNRGALLALNRLGPPPYDSGEERDELERIAANLRGDCLNPFQDSRYWPIAAQCKWYSEHDWRNVTDGTHYSQSCFWDQIFLELDLTTQVPKVHVPVNFLVGEHDTLSPWRVSQRYFERLEAPQGKRFCRIKAAMHWPHLEMPSAYRAALQSLLAVN